MLEFMGYQRLALGREGTSCGSLQITPICALSVYHKKKLSSIKMTGTEKWSSIKMTGTEKWSSIKMTGREMEHYKNDWDREIE